MAASGEPPRQLCLLVQLDPESILLPHLRRLRELGRPWVRTPQKGVALRLPQDQAASLHHNCGLLQRPLAYKYLMLLSASLRGDCNKHFLCKLNSPPPLIFVSFKPMSVEFLCTIDAAACFLQVRVVKSGLGLFDNYTALKAFSTTPVGIRHVLFRGSGPNSRVWYEFQCCQWPIVRPHKSKRAE